MSLEQIPLFELSSDELLWVAPKSTPRYVVREKQRVPLGPEDILHGRFTLPFRFRLAYTVDYLTGQHDFSLERILTSSKQQFLKLCSVPQEGRYLTKSEIMAQTTGDPNSERFRSTLGWVFARVWRRAMVGPRAIENLMPSDYLYFTIIKYGQKQTIDDLVVSSPRDVARMCPTVQLYEELMERLGPYAADLSLVRPKYPHEQEPRVFFAPRDAH